jgi:hypothetical protein
MKRCSPRTLGTVALMGMVLIGGACANPSRTGSGLSPPTAPTASSNLVTCARPGHSPIPAPSGRLISRTEAIERACEEEGRGLQATGVVAVLGWYRTHPNSPRIRVWDVTYQGVLQGGDGGPPAPGVSPQPPMCQLGDDEVAIDAHTGAFLVSGTGPHETATPCP